MELGACQRSEQSKREERTHRAVFEEGATLTRTPRLLYELRPSGRERGWRQSTLRVEKRLGLVI